MIKNKEIPLICLILTAAALIAFWRINQCDFIIYDDSTYVTENMHIRHGVTADAARWAFTTGYASNWHPLTWISHMLDIQIFGLKPQWHHLVNLLFHTINTLLLFIIFQQMTKEAWKSAFIAALFAVHPLHVESVAWVAERKDVLSTFFWMLTMAAYVRYADSSSIFRSLSTLLSYIAALIFFVCGLMAKPMLVTLPFVLLLLDYWPLRRFDPYLPKKISRLRPLLLEKIPFLVFAALSCVVTYIVQQKGGAVKTFEAFPLSERISNAFVSYVIYIGKTIWPTNLAVYYPHPGARPLLQVLGAVVLLAAITITLVPASKRRPYLAFGWLWFAGTLVPVIGIVQIGSQAMADRYSYIPLIGLFIMMAWGIPEALKNLRYRREVFFASSSSIIVCLATVTWIQTGYWLNDITLYDHSMNVTGKNDIMLNNRGVAYAQLGNLKDSISNYNAAIEINPRYAEAFNNRGIAYEKLGDHTRAISDYDKAVETGRGNADIFNNRGIAYGNVGDHRHAIENFDKSIELDPEDTEAYFNRCIAHDNLGNHRQAIQDCGRAIEIQPEKFEAYLSRGVAYGEIGNHRRAIEDFDKVIEIKPEDGRAYFNRAISFSQIGNNAQAVEDLKTAAKCRSEEARDLLKNRGISW